ncbi:hypothetical protein SteCoe_10266 [Stentor coeruleus]|uniref:Uncharacterized protein n=1 Tax=Stentor coeruleus TaxID=5963 RepID=A0A1R2CG71_9CILI|nr:hypothetical protein SteCoe_10266 [Stentor coeruleus]
MGCSPSNPKVSQDQNDPYVQVETQEKLPPNVFEAFKSFHNQASQVHQKSLITSTKSNVADKLISHNISGTGHENQTDHSNANNLNSKNSPIPEKSEKSKNHDKQSLEDHKRENIQEINVEETHSNNEIGIWKYPNKKKLLVKEQKPEPEQENSLKISNSSRQLPLIDLNSSRNKKFIID